jgi:ribose transport system substrate-binding protein
MKRLTRVIAVLATASACLLAGCSSGQSGGSGTESADAGGTAGSVCPGDVDPAALVPPSIVGRGPDDVEAALPDAVALTADEIAAAKAKAFTVGIVMQTMDIEWSTEQVRGITDRLKEYGASVVGVVDPQFQVEKQIAGIQNMVLQKPDAIISIPVDDTATAEAYKSVSAAGIKLILMDNVPRGLQHPAQYQSMISSDNQGNGAVAAEVLAKCIPDGGTVGVIGFGVDFFVTDERERGFVGWMEENRPDITIKSADFIDPADSGDVASNFLTANPDVAGMFTVWEVPAMGIVSAQREQGKDIPVVSINIASDVALDLASGGLVKGFGAQVPYDQGLAEADAAIGALLGKQLPKWVAFPAVPVVQGNVLQAWQDVYHGAPPAELVDACAASGACGNAP